MLMCRGLAIIASDYIDGELGAVDNLAVRMHLLMCRRCRSFIGSLRNSVQLMRNHSSYRLDVEFAKRIDAEIANALNTDPPDSPNDRSDN